MVETLITNIIMSEHDQVLSFKFVAEISGTQKYICLLNLIELWYIL